MNETVEKFDDKESFDFDDFLSNNQFNNLLIMDRFFKDIYRELSDANKGICLETFREFITLPSYISDKIFHCMDKKNNKHLSLHEFLEGMKSLYNGNFEQLTKFIFEFYDFDRDGKIIYEDVKQIQLLILPPQYHSQEVFDSINDSLHTFFEDYTNMEYDTFVDVTENFNSDIFMNLIIYFYVNKPFSNEILSYYLSDKRLATELSLNKVNKFTLKKTFTHCEPENRKNFGLTNQNDTSIVLNYHNHPKSQLKVGFKGPNRLGIANQDKKFKKQNELANAKNIIKTPKNNLYLKGISENYCRKVTYTDPQQCEDVVNVIKKELNKEELDDYDFFEDPAEEFEYNSAIKIPIVRRFKNLFNPLYYEEKARGDYSNIRLSSEIIKKRSLTENDVIEVMSLTRSLVILLIRF